MPTINDMHNVFVPQDITVFSDSDAEVADLLAAVQDAQTGIDWAAVLRSLAAAENRDGEGQCWLHLGCLRELLPSRKCYTLAHIGAEVSDEAAERDLAWLRALRAEAGALGLAVASDDWGDGLWLVAPVVTLVQVGGRLIRAS